MKYILFAEPKVKKGRKFKTALLIDNKGDFVFSQTIKLKTAKEIIKELQNIINNNK